MEHLSTQHPLRIQYGRTGGGGPWLSRRLLQGKYWGIRVSTVLSHLRNVSYVNLSLSD